MAEDSKVSIRSIRREAMDEAKKLQKDNEMTEDELKGSEDKIQKLTDNKIAEIDKILSLLYNDSVAVIYFMLDDLGCPA